MSLFCLPGISFSKACSNKIIFTFCQVKLIVDEWDGNGKINVLLTHLCGLCLMQNCYTLWHYEVRSVRSYKITEFAYGISECGEYVLNL